MLQEGEYKPREKHVITLKRCSPLICAQPAAEKKESKAKSYLEEVFSFDICSTCSSPEGSKASATARKGYAERMTISLQLAGLCTKSRHEEPCSRGQARWPWTDWPVQIQQETRRKQTRGHEIQGEENTEESGMMTGTSREAGKRADIVSESYQQSELIFVWPPRFWGLGIH